MRILTFVLLLLPLLAVRAEDGLADQVVVNKSERRLYLLRDGEVLRSYEIALGLSPEGHKSREGDFRTPEGDYRLRRRVIDSDFFMSIEISYPNMNDIAAARSMGVSPGGNIMIHGQPNNPKKPPRYYANYDWTDGCIAVSNLAMTDIWQLTKVDTPISIIP